MKISRSMVVPSLYGIMSHFIILSICIAINKKPVDFHFQANNCTFHAYMHTW